MVNSTEIFGYLLSEDGSFILNEDGSFIALDSSFRQSLPPNPSTILVPVTPDNTWVISQKVPSSE